MLHIIGPTKTSRKRLCFPGCNLNKKMHFSFKSSILLKLVLAVALFASLFSFAVNAQKPKADVEYSSYLAHIGAASNALQLHETADAKRWLAAAPLKFRNWEWHYLNSLSEQSEAAMTMATGSVNAIAVSPDGRLLLTTSVDKSVRLSDSSGKEIYKFTDEKFSPQSVAFTADGRHFAAAFSRHTVKIWETATGKEIRTLQGEGKGITAIAFSPDNRSMASASWNVNQQRGVWGIVEIWDFETGESTKKLEYGAKPLVSIQYSPDGKLLAVGSWEVQDTVALWQVGDWSRPFLLESEKDDVYKALQSLTFSPDSKLLAAGGKDSVVRIWDVESRKRLFSMGDHTKFVNGVAFSADGKTLASVSTDQTVRLWDVATGKVKRTMHGHTKAVNAVMFSPDGSKIFSASSDRTVRVWATMEKKPEMVKLDGSAYGLAFSPDARLAVSAAWLGKIRVWDAETRREIDSWQAHKSSANAAAFSRDGKRLATVGNDGLIKIWDFSTRKELKTLEEVKGNQLIAIGFCGSGYQVISISAPGTAKIFDAETGNVVNTFAHEKGVSVAHCSADGKIAATGGNDGSVIIWDAQTGKQIFKLNPHRSKIMALAFSPDGKSFATASADRDAKLINLKNGTEAAVFSGHDDQLSGLSFSIDGTRIATASSDQTVRIWDTKTGQNVLSIPYEIQVYTAVFGPDKKSLWTLPLDGTIRVLNGN